MGDLPLYLFFFSLFFSYFFVRSITFYWGGGGGKLPHFLFFPILFHYFFLTFYVGVDPIPHHIVLTRGRRATVSKSFFFFLFAFHFSEQTVDLCKDTSLSSPCLASKNKERMIFFLVFFFFFLLFLSRVYEGILSLLTQAMDFQHAN